MVPVGTDIIGVPGRFLGFMFLLLAQLVAPPLQRGPVRLPAAAPLERPREKETAPIDTGPEQPPPRQPSPAPQVPPPQPPRSLPTQPTTQGPASSALPAIHGSTPYTAANLRRLLAPCSAISPEAERLRACAAALTAALVADGYINTRVYEQPTPPPGALEVVEGRLVELRVNGPDPRLNGRVLRWLRPLQGRLLHLPSLEEQLRRLKAQPGVGTVRGNLSRLGSDPAMGVFTVSVNPAQQPWRGELSLSNDGSNGSGEFQQVGSLAKGDLIRRGDSLLLYEELGVDRSPSFGQLITSISYTLPLSERFTLTGAFGFSRRNLIELPDPADGFSTSQYQGFGQLEWLLHDTLAQRWSLFLGLSANRSNTYFEDQALPAEFVSESVRSPRSGYLRFGVSGSGLGPNLAWSGNAYLLQGIAGITPALQRQELASVGIEAGQATAIGGLVTLAWGIAPRWQARFQAAGQVAFDPLLSPMQFTLGSDVGLRGLPNQFVSGDNGWLATGEVAWTFWQKGAQVLQLVPFLGAGGVSTTVSGVTFSDTVGAGGILARWVQGNHWLVELGWVKQFWTEDNPGSWTDWTLADGLYGKIQYRF